ITRARHRATPRGGPSVQLEHAVELFADDRHSLAVAEEPRKRGEKVHFLDRSNQPINAAKNHSLAAARLGRVKEEPRRGEPFVGAAAEHTFEAAVLGGEEVDRRVSGGLVGRGSILERAHFETARAAGLRESAEGGTWLVEHHDEVARD